MPQQHPIEPHRVCALIDQNIHLFELGIVTEIFGLPRPEYKSWYDFRILSLQDQHIQGLGGLRIGSQTDIEFLKKATTILIPGWNIENRPISPLLKSALHEAYENGSRIASICSGAFLLAACGFLKEKQSTTHWRYAELLQTRYPDTNVNPDVLYIDEGQILTSAGSAAGIDLCLHLVRQDFGRDIANEVARRLVMPAHREGGQRQFIPRPLTIQRSGRLGPLLDHIRENLHQTWTIQKMSDYSGLSVRSLNRRFKDITGIPPLAWLTSERIEFSKELLEKSEISLTEIIETIGFSSPETFRHHFKQKTGVSPSHYRKMFHNQKGTSNNFMI